MTLADIAKIRITSQHIAGTTFTTPRDVVGWMGAMQAQDYAVAKWALGVRLHGSTDGAIESTLNYAGNGTKTTE
jgi:hypothetical protein